MDGKIVYKIKCSQIWTKKCSIDDFSYILRMKNEWF